MAALQKTLLADEEQRLQEIKNFIDKNFQEDLNVGSLAKRFSYSKNTLKRHFLANFSKSITYYIHTLRMNAAMQLLLDHKIGISQIGSAVGYKDRTSFTKAFTKFFNHPPIFFCKDDVNI